MNKKNYTPKLIKFKKYKDKSGYLIPFEYIKKNLSKGNLLPFKIKRGFFSSGIKNYFRGNHAHKKCTQLLVCLSGRILIETIYGHSSKKFTIDSKSNKALLIPPMVWNKIFFKIPNSLMAVFCNYKYDFQKEYINNFSQFQKLSILKKNK